MPVKLLLPPYLQVQHMLLLLFVLREFLYLYLEWQVWLFQIHLRYQAFDNMGLQSTQTLGVIVDGGMRNTKEGLEFVELAKTKGVGAAIEKRDGPFNDYSMGSKEDQPFGVPEML